MTAPRLQTGDDDTVALGTLTQSLGFLIRMSQLRMYDVFCRIFEGLDTSPGEITTLWGIDLNPEVRQGALARVLNIKPAHMTKLVQRLVRSGLVVRRVPPEDRRSVRLSLTPKGLQHLDGLRQTFLSVHTAENIGLTPTESTQLRVLLHKLAFPGAPS